MRMGPSRMNDLVGIDLFGRERAKTLGFRRSDPCLGVSDMTEEHTRLIYQQHSSLEFFRIVVLRPCFCNVAVRKSAPLLTARGAYVFSIGRMKRRRQTPGTGRLHTFPHDTKTIVEARKLEQSYPHILRIKYTGS